MVRKSPIDDDINIPDETLISRFHSGQTSMFKRERILKSENMPGMLKSISKY